MYMCVHVHSLCALFENDYVCIVVCDCMMSVCVCVQCVCMGVCVLMYV